jgi:hypothetical protein
MSSLSLPLLFFSFFAPQAKNRAKRGPKTPELKGEGSITCPPTNYATAAQYTRGSHSAPGTLAALLSVFRFRFHCLKKVKVKGMKDVPWWDERGLKVSTS